MDYTLSFIIFILYFIVHATCEYAIRTTTDVFIFFAFFPFILLIMKNEYLMQLHTYNMYKLYICTCITHLSFKSRKKSNTNNIVILWYSWLKIRMRITYVCKKKLKSKKQEKKNLLKLLFHLIIFSNTILFFKFCLLSYAYMFAIQ